MSLMSKLMFILIYIDLGGGISVKKCQNRFVRGAFVVQQKQKQKKLLFLCVVNCFPLSTPILIFIESLPTNVKILFHNWMADDCQSLLNGFWLPPIDRICQNLGERICLIVKNKFYLLCPPSFPVMLWETCCSWSTPESRLSYIGVWDLFFPQYLILNNLHSIKLYSRL